MHSISNKLFYRSAVALRRLWLLNCTRNARVIQSPLSCSAYRHVQLFTDEPITVDKSIKFPSNNLALQNVRFQSTAQGSESSVEAMEEKATSGDIMIKKIISILRVIAGPLMKKTVIIGSARNMYECCVDGMNFEEFFEACELPDTFQSWFIVLHLHVWMCLVRLKVEGKDGRYMYRKLVEMMWFDVEERMKNLGTIDSQVLRDNLRVLVKQFYGLTIALDEGLLCDDTVLATALWRNMFYNKKGTDAEALGRLVEYVRKNVQHLETYTTDHLLYNSGKLSWLPFKEEEEETAKEEGVDKE